MGRALGTLPPPARKPPPRSLLRLLPPRPRRADANPSAGRPAGSGVPRGPGVEAGPLLCSLHRLRLGARRGAQAVSALPWRAARHRKNDPARNHYSFCSSSSFPVHHWRQDPAGSSCAGPCEPLGTHSPRRAAPCLPVKPNIWWTCKDAPQTFVKILLPFVFFPRHSSATLFAVFNSQTDVPRLGRRLSAQLLTQALEIFPFTLQDPSYRNPGSRQAAPLTALRLSSEDGSQCCQGSTTHHHTALPPRSP